MDENSRSINMFVSLKEKWKLIVLITVAMGLVSGIVSYFFLTPIYQSSTQILVNQKNRENQFDSALLQSNVDLINTYSVIIKSPRILDKVIKKLQLSESVENLNQKITVNSKENSQVFTLTVEDSDPVKAVTIANTLSVTFQQEIKGIMNVDNVSILAEAELKEHPVQVSPKPLLNIAIAIVVGLLFGIGLVFLLEIIDNTLKDEADVAAQLKLPVLGSVQMMPAANNKGRKGTKVQKVGSERVVSYSGK